MEGARVPVGRFEASKRERLVQVLRKREWVGPKSRVWPSLLIDAALGEKPSGRLKFLVAESLFSSL